MVILLTFLSYIQLYLAIEIRRTTTIIKKGSEYKKEKKQTYKPIGITRLKKKLLQMAAGDPDTMLAIVEDSIANNYSGLYDTRHTTDPMDTGVILHNSPYHDPKEGGW